jgi:eukaryotic-like serine/threonine-protein kinase
MARMSHTTTNKDEWARVDAAFDALLDLDAPSRAIELEKIGRTDPELRVHLESLLSHSQADDGLLDHPAMEAFAALPTPAALTRGALIGSYRIIDMVGRGGNGEVYAAERADGYFHQRVALKVIRHDAADQLDRFETERQILANLNHPNIARLLDGGLTEDGQPYMVMEFVDGSPILHWCRAAHAPLAVRLRLFLDICDATSFAHQHLVVHRDLKPGNVLVTPEGAVKLLDFGAAKLIGPATEHTQNAPLTPAYAAPEQLAGGQITTATDVYALGLLLFELLCGEPPWRLNTLSFAAALEAVLNREPPRASEFAAKHANPPVPARSLRGDLDAIVARALRKEPARRYHTVDALREDIRASIEERPVVARDGNVGYVLGRSLRRHKALAAGALAVVLALAGGGAGVAWQAERARAEARKETAVKEFLLNIFRTNSVNNPDGVSARQTTAEQLLDRGTQAVAGALEDAPEARAELIDALADLYDELDDYDKVDMLERQRLKDLERSDGKQPSPARARALAELGRALAMSDRYAEAATTLRDALNVMDEIGDDRSAARVQALTTWGLVDYHVLAASDPAAGTHTAAALAILEKYDPSSSDRMSAVQLLARIAERRGDRVEAERGYRAFLSLAESPAFREQRVALGSALSDYGSFLASEHRYAEAAPMLARAVEMLDHAEGPNGEMAAVARTNLADLYAATTRPIDAERLYQAALASIEHNQGVDNGAATSLARRSLAALEHARGRFAAAQALIERNLVVLSTPASTEIRESAATQAEWASLLFDEGKYVEANRAQIKAAALFAQLDQSHSVEEALGRVTAAHLAASADRDEEAMRGYSAVAAEWNPSPIPSAPYVNAELGLGHLHLRRGDAVAAAAVAGDLLGRIDALPADERSIDWVAQAHRLAGLAALATGDADTAVSHLGRAAEFRQAFDDEHSPFLERARTELRRAAAAAQRKVRARGGVPLARASATPGP